MSAESIAMVTADAAGTITAWSGHASDWFGYRADQMLGRLVDELVPAEFREAHRSGLQRAMSGGELHLVGAATHLPVLHADGRIVVHPARFHHLTDPYGALVAAAAVFGPRSATAAPWQSISGEN